MTNFEKWCRQRDLNPQPTDYKSVALPIVLCRRMGAYYRFLDQIVNDFFRFISLFEKLYKRPLLTQGLESTYNQNATYFGSNAHHHPLRKP
jgi:hypothetical protein